MTSVLQNLLSGYNVQEPFNKDHNESKVGRGFCSWGLDKGNGVDREKIDSGTI